MRRIECFGEENSLYFRTRQANSAAAKNAANAAYSESMNRGKRGSRFSPTAKNASVAGKNASMTAKNAVVERLCETLP